MKTTSCIFAAGLLAALPLVSAHATINRVVEKTFAVQPGGTLKVETSGGNVTVQPGSDDQVHVVAHQKIRAKTETEADELLTHLTLDLEQAGNDVTARAKYEKRMSGFHFKSWPPVSVSFVVTVPANFNAKLHTSGGDITIGDLAGKIEGRTSGGDVGVGRIEGDVRIGTSGGDIQLAAATGRADLETSGGDITLGSVAGSLDAHTSGGDIKASISGKLTSDCSLGTSGGDVTVNVDRGVGFDLDASTSGGDVDATGLTITIERGGIGKNRLAGPVNGGGPRLRLRTSGGDVTVRAR